MTPAAVTCWRIDPGNILQMAGQRKPLQLIENGAPIGSCRVAISLTGPPPPLPEHLAKAEAAAETMQMPGKPLIPKKYFSADTSKLKAEVKSGSNTFDFDLEGDLKP